MPLRGPQPKTTCEYCGKRLSMHALPRHQTTLKCLIDSRKQKLQREFPQPKGTTSIPEGQLKKFTHLLSDAGYTPDDAPIHYVPVWSHQQIQVLLCVPIWFSAALHCLHAQEYASHSAKDKKERAVERGKFAVLQSDTVTLLQAFRDNNEAELAMSAELDLVCKEVVDQGTWEHVFHDWVKAPPIIRQWASEVLKNNV